MTSLKQLRYFDAVVRLGHFGKAAEVCAISQPALSMQIQNLEASLGTQLLERNSSGVLPTGIGREIAKRAADILRDVQDMEDFARHGFELLSGPLRLGVIPSIAPYVLPPLLPKIKKQHPSLDLHIRESQTASLVDGLLRGDLDLLLLALPFEENGREISTRPLFTDNFVLAVPNEQVPSGKYRAGPELLEGEDLLLLEEGHCMRDQAIAYCQLQQTGNIHTQGASSLSTLVQMVANGMGITLLPEMSLKVESRHKDISILPFDDPAPSREIGLAWRKTSPRKKDFEKFGELVMQIAG